MHGQMRYGSLFIIGTNNQHGAVCIKIMKYGNSSQLTPGVVLSWVFRSPKS